MPNGSMGLWSKKRSMELWSKLFYGSMGLWSKKHSMELWSKLFYGSIVKKYDYAGSASNGKRPSVLDLSFLVG